MLLILKYIFDITSTVFKYLQSANIDFFQAVIFIDQALEQIATLWNRDKDNSMFYQIEQQTITLAFKWNIEQSLEINRNTTVKRITKENCSDESLLKPLDKFRTETFFIIVDAIWSKFKSDFKESKAIIKEMSVFQMDRMFSIERDALPSNAFTAICEWLPEVDIVQLKDEYLQLSQNLDVIISDSKLLHRLHSNANYENSISSFNTSSKTDDEDNVFVLQSICELFKKLSALNLRVIPFQMYFWR